MSPDNILNVINAHTGGAQPQLTTRYACRHYGQKRVALGGLLVVLGVIGAVLSLLMAIGNGMVLLTSLPVLAEMEGEAARVLSGVGQPITYALFMAVLGLSVMLFIMKKAHYSVATYLDNHLWLMHVLSDGTRTPQSIHEKQARASELSRPLWRWALLIHVTLVVAIAGISAYLSTAGLPGWAELNQWAGQLAPGTNAFFPLLSTDYTWVYPMTFGLAALLPVGLWVLAFAQSRVWILLSNEIDRMPPRYGLTAEEMRV